MNYAIEYNELNYYTGLIDNKHENNKIVEFPIQSKHNAVIVYQLKFSKISLAIKTYFAIKHNKNSIVLGFTDEME